MRWTVLTVQHDFLYPYSASKAAAHYIKHQGMERTPIFGAGRFAFAIQPYFLQNIFANYTNGKALCFYSWSTMNHFDRTVDEVIRECHPDILLSCVWRNPADAPIPEISGYTRVSFEGYIFQKDRLTAVETVTILQKEP